MIRVNKDYVIFVDSYNYIAKRDLHRKVTRANKSGETKEQDTYSTVGYYSSLVGAFKGIAEDATKKHLQTGIHTLEDAINTVVENNRYFTDLLEKLDFDKEKDTQEEYEND